MNICLICSKKFEQNKNGTRVYCSRSCRDKKYRDSQDKTKVSDYHKSYRKKNKDRIFKQRKDFRDNNHEKLSNLARSYYLTNSEIIKHKSRERNKIYPKKKKSSNKKYYENNYSKIRIKKIIWINNNKKSLREKQRIYQKNRLINDLNFKIRRRLSNRLWCVINRGNIPKDNLINYKAIIEYLQPFPNEICRYHIDHIKPLSSFDLTKPNEIKKAFAPENHQWLLAKDNLSKGSKIIVGNQS